MKRSEMYKIMVDTIREGLKDYNKINMLDIAVHMDQVLIKIEELGMLPPLNRHDLQIDGDNANEKSVTYRTWEPEDKE